MTEGVVPACVAPRGHCWHRSDTGASFQRSNSGLPGAIIDVVCCDCALRTKVAEFSPHVVHKTQETRREHGPHDPRKPKEGT